MVSPFMAFAKGAFEGYNDMKDAEKEHEYNMALQKEVNAGKTVVEADPMFKVLERQGNIYIFYFARC